jgi:hypothetical protein
MKTQKIATALTLSLALCVSSSFAHAANKPTSCPSGSDMKTVLQLLKSHPELYLKDIESYHLNRYTTVSGLPTSVAQWMQRNHLSAENGGIHLGPVAALRFNSKLFSSTQPGVLKSITKGNVTDYYCDYSDNLYGALVGKKHPLFVIAESY